MSFISWRRVLVVPLFLFVFYFVWDEMRAESRRSSSTEVELDRLIPREKWGATGLNKLTSAEQQTLAEEISALVSPAQLPQTAPTTQSGSPDWRDKSQWRKLQRGMSKDDVRKLLGEPGKISSAKFYEFWYYAGGNVTFDNKGRLDYWDEP